METKNDNLKNAKHCKLLFIDDKLTERIYKLAPNDWRERLNRYIEKGLENNLI